MVTPVRARPPVVPPDLSEDVGALGPAFAKLGSATKQLSANITRPVGTIGSYRAEGLPDLADVSAGMSSLSARATRGKGTIARAMRGDLRVRASRAMAAADSIGNSGIIEQGKHRSLQARHDARHQRESRPRGSRHIARSALESRRRDCRRPSGQRSHATAGSHPCVARLTHQRRQESSDALHQILT